MAFCAKCGAQIPADATFCPACGTPVSAVGGQVRPSGLDTLTKSVGAQEYWVKRLLAFVVDAIIVYVVIDVVVLLASIPAVISGTLAPFSFVGGLFAAISGILFVLYFTLAELLYGRTIGKNVFGLRVKTDDGKRLTFSDALIRNISKIYWVLLLLDVVLGLALETGYSKKYTDKYAGTTVSPA